MTLQDSLRSINDRSVSECCDPAGSIAMRQLVSICHAAAGKIDEYEKKIGDIATIVDKQDCFVVEGVLSLNERHKQACKQIVDLIHERDAVRAPGTMLSYSLHDKIVKMLEEKLHEAYLARERARSERDAAMANRKYAPPMIVRFNHQDWEDGEHVVTLDGEPVGGTVTPDAARSIVRWMGTAWAELIERNTMKHRQKPATVSGADAFGNVVLQTADCPPSPKDGCH